MAVGAQRIGEVVAGAPRGKRRYAAFISYSHADDAFGTWLHRKLEGYEIPSAFRRAGAKRLGPIFRDRVDLGAKHDLGAEIRLALENADALVVLCSPRSASSRYVDEEIRYFKQLGKGERIFAAIVDGEPHAAGKPGRTEADECFPPALLYQIDAAGGLSQVPETNEPIAADFREGKDGRENGALKLIAGLLDVGLDELVQREKQAERRRRHRANLLAGVMAVLALGAVAAGAVAWWQQGVAETRRVEADTARGVAVEARGRAEQKEKEANDNFKLAEQRREEAAKNAEERDIQRLAAEANAKEASEQRDIAQTTLMRFFVERSNDALAKGNVTLAVKYSLAGLVLSPANAGLYEAALTRAMFAAEDAASSLAFPAGPAQVLPDRKRVVVMGKTEAGVWEATSGRKLVGFGAAATGAAGVVLSRDGSRAAAIGAESGITVWDTNTGTLVLTLKTERRILTGKDDTSQFALSSDGRLAALAAADGLVLWDVDTATPRPRIDFHAKDKSFSGVIDGKFTVSMENHRSEFDTISFSPDGSKFVARETDEDTLGIWDVATRTRIAVLETNPPQFRTAVFTPDGGAILTAGADQDVAIWSAAGGRKLGVLPHRWVGSIAFSPDGARVATGGLVDHAVKVWEFASARQLAQMSGHLNDVNAVDFSPDGTRIVSTGEAIRVWNAMSGEQVSAYLEQSGEAWFTSDGQAVLSIAGSQIHSFRPAGKLLASMPGKAFALLGTDRLVVANDKIARVYGLADGRLVATAPQHEKEIESIAISRDGLLAATTDATNVKVWSTANGALISHLQPPEGKVAQLATFSPDGTQVLAGTGPFGQGEIWRWETRSGKALEPYRRKSYEHVSRILYSASGAQMLLVGSPPAVSMDPKTGVLGREYPRHESVLAAASLSANGTRVITSVGSDGVVYETDSGKRLATLDGHRAQITSAAFSSDATKAATASYDRAIRIWNVETGATIAIATGHTLWVDFISFLADGRRLLTKSWDRTARVWNAATGDLIATFDHAGAQAAWSADGRYLITASSDSEGVRVWDARRLSQPLFGIIEQACRRGELKFGSAEIAGDPLLQSQWTEGRDICAGLDRVLSDLR